MRDGPCHLCGQIKPLIKAHIIPRSFFHQLRGGTKQLLAGINRDQNPVELSQSGFWDDGILCCACEALFAPWDAYGFEILGNPPGNNSPLSSDADIQPFLLKNLDYAKLKMFILGTLWRASTTKHKFFDGIKLGPHESLIGNLIRNNQPGSMGEYSVIVGRLVQQRYERIIYAPRSSKVRGIHFCIFYLPSLKIMVKVDKRPLAPELTLMALKPSGVNIALPMNLDRAEFQYLQIGQSIFKRWQPKRPPKLI